MKNFIAILLFQLCFVGLFSQTYISNKQHYSKKSSYDYTEYTGDRKITIKGNIVEIELTDSENSIFNGKVNKKAIDKDSYGASGSIYYFEGGGVIAVYPTYIFANLDGTSVGAAITYYFPNYTEPLADQKKEAERVAKVKAEKSMYDMYVELYGKFTADCIRDQEIRIGMKEEALVHIPKRLIMWEKINKIETSSGVRKQYVYPNNKYVYVENGVVTAIQSEGY